MAARARDIEKIREKLLLATLAHVPFDGWSAAAIRAGAADAGLSLAEALNAFPAGPNEALALFSDWADRQMLARLETAELGNMKVREKVAAGVRLRLEVLQPSHDLVPVVLLVRQNVQDAELEQAFAKLPDPFVHNYLLIRSRLYVVYNT